MIDAQTMNQDRFLEATSAANAWAKIDTLVALCDEHGFWNDEFLSHTADNAKKAFVRRMIKTLKTDDGDPVWASVETTDDEGKTVRVYKQETLFNVDDYRQVVSYHGDRANHHREMALGYARRCKKRFGKQIATMFGEADAPRKPR